jgi:hypothetical protein
LGRLNSEFEETEVTGIGFSEEAPFGSWQKTLLRFDDEGEENSSTANSALDSHWLISLSSSCEEAVSSTGAGDILLRYRYKFALFNEEVVDLCRSSKSSVLTFDPKTATDPVDARLRAFATATEAEEGLVRLVEGVDPLIIGYAIFFASSGSPLRKLSW